MRLPEHACALLVDPRGCMILQLRPASARHAPSQLTCFGGKREAGETAEACLRRELGEELGWAPDVVPAEGLDLRSGGCFIARFFAIALPDGVVLRTEPGSIAVRAHPRSLPGLPLSPWHEAAITGWGRGQVEVRV